MSTIMQNLIQKQGTMIMGMQERLDATDATVAHLKQKVAALESAPPVVAPRAVKAGAPHISNVEFRKECDYTEDELNATSKPALMTLCAAHNLPKTANKPVLIARLLKNTDVATSPASATSSSARKGRAKAGLEPRDEADYTEEELASTTNACLAAICKHHGLKKPIGKPELIKTITGYVNSDNKSEYTANKKPVKRKKPIKAPEPRHNHPADGTTHDDCDHCTRYGDITDPHSPQPQVVSPANGQTVDEALAALAPSASPMRYSLSPVHGQTVDEALAALEGKDIEDLLNNDKDTWEMEQTLVEEDDDFNFSDGDEELFEE